MNDEAELQAAIVDLATQLGLVCLHLRAPAHEAKTWTGFPDLFIARPGGLVMFRELKMPGKRLRSGQQQWAAILAGQDYAVWKPHDWHAGRIRSELEAFAGQTLPANAPETPQERLWRALARAASSEIPGV